jgi:hypothetical protein
MKLKNLFAPDRSASHSSMEDEVAFCCGKHAVCEKMKAVQAVNEPVEYYDDEELDIFKNRPSDSYSENET